MGTHTQNVNTLAGVIYGYPHTECGLWQGSSMGTHTQNVNTLAGVIYGYPHTECKHTGRGHLWVPTHRMWTVAGVIYGYPHTECGLWQGPSMGTHTQNVNSGRGQIA